MRKAQRQASSLFDSSSATDVSYAFDPSRLTQARLLARLTKQALGAELGITPAAVGQYEAGVIVPRAQVIEELARALKVPIAFFAVGRPHARLDVSSAHFRSLRRTRVLDRQRAVAYVEQLWELANALEDYVELPPIDLPDIPEDASPRSAAQVVRSHWSIPAGPVQHLVRSAESHGILLSFLPFAEDSTAASIDAFSTSRTLRPIIILTPDRADDVFRHRFTAAHELGHLLLHREATAGDAEQEREADQFAAEFLTPADEIIDDLPSRLNLKELETLSRHWGVSIESLIFRSRETQLASEAATRRAYQRVRAARTAGLLRSESIERYPGEQPILLSDAFSLAEQHGLSLVALAKLLALPSSRVRSLLGHRETRPSLQIAPAPQRTM